MEKIRGNPCTLALPVKPYTPYTVMEMIMSYDNIDSGMELDASRLGSGNIPLVVYMVDMVIFYDREYTSEITYYSCLSTVMDIAVPYDMGAHDLLAPSVKLCYQSTIPLRLRTVLKLVMRPLVVIVLLHVFAERYAAALAL